MTSSDEPLGLPRGSVRAILTIISLVFVGLTLFIPVTGGSDGVRTGLLALVVMCVRDYFAHRRHQSAEAGPPVPPASIG